MKQFAFPLSIKCASVEERDECVKLLCSIGYESTELDNDYTVITNYSNACNMLSTCPPSLSFKYSNNRHHIDHFNPDLIRDIASVCTNDTWQKDEPYIYSSKYYPHNKINNSAGKMVSATNWLRPTIAEICEHHGYEIKGRDIVKKEEKISEPDDSHAFITEKMKEIYLSFKELNNLRAISEINRLKAENAELKEKLEAVTDVDNHELERLRSENAELKVKYKMSQEAYNSARNREIKLKDLLIDIASEMD